MSSLKMGLFSMRRSSSRGMDTPTHGFRLSTWMSSVAFYPICQSRRSKRIHFVDSKIPLLFLLGELDDWTDISVCVTKAKQYRQEGRSVEWKVYSGAHHAFDNDRYIETRTSRGKTLEYDQSADHDSWKRLLAFLDKYVRRTETK